MITRFLKTCCLTGIPFGVAMSIVYAIIEGPKIGSLLGLGAGLPFGIIMAAFLECLRKKMAIDGDKLNGEDVLHQNPANHFLNAEARGGFLYLTKAHLVFRAHKMNLQSSEIIIPLSEITEVKPIRTLGIVPNGILVTHGDGKREKYVVTGRKQWIDHLTKAKRLS